MTAFIYITMPNTKYNNLKQIHFYIKSMKWIYSYEPVINLNCNLIERYWKKFSIIKWFTFKPKIKNLFCKRENVYNLSVELDLFVVFGFQHSTI